MSTIFSANQSIGSESPSSAPAFYIRDGLQDTYSDVYTPEVLDALARLTRFNDDRLDLMKKRIERRAKRFRDHERIDFLPADALIPRTNIKVQDARDGKFEGSPIPKDLERQWIQGTGPGAKPDASTQSSIRNVAYALLSGADGWMFDGEDALGQISTMSLDNQRNLKLASPGTPSSWRPPRRGRPR
jgi:malate synthase